MKSENENASISCLTILEDIYSDLLRDLVKKAFDYRIDLDMDSYRIETRYLSMYISSETSENDEHLVIEVADDEPYILREYDVAEKYKTELETLVTEVNMFIEIETLKSIKELIDTENKEEE